MLYLTDIGDCSHEIKRCLLLERKVMSNLDSIFKSRDITLPTKVRLVKAMVFPWSCMDVRVGLWRRLSAEKLMLLNCGVGEDSLEFLGLQGDATSPFWRRSTLGFFGRNDAKAEPPTSWEELTHWKRFWHWKWLVAGGEGSTEDEMARWPHWLDGCESEWTLGDGDEQGGLACCDSWGRKESDTTEQLNWTDWWLYSGSEK